MILTKAFDTPTKKLLIATLKNLIATFETYGLDSWSSTFFCLQSYLTKHYERTRKSNTFSDWESIIAVVPQGLVLRRLLFNIFRNIFFCMEKSDPRNSADDGTLYTADRSVSQLRDILKKDFKNFYLKHIFADINLKDLKI